MDQAKLSPEAIEAILQRALTVTVSGVDAQGRPLQRTFDTALHEGCLLFHGAPRGGKLDLEGGQVVASVHEVLARLPSYFSDSERACPATTFYRSVQIEGVVERVDAPEAKAVLLQRLMEGHQPEGGYVPLAGNHTHDLYRASVRSLLVARIVPQRVVARQNIGQRKSGEGISRILEGLWHRGDPGDLEVLEMLGEEHPLRPCLSWTKGPEGVRLHFWPRPEDARRAAELLREAYWRTGETQARLAAMQRGSQAWVGARSPTGELVATARAVTDGVDLAMVADVIVDPRWRGRGLGTAVVRALLDHPRVRRVGRVRLGTRDAMPFYRRFGFREIGTVDDRTLMSLIRGQRPATQPGKSSAGARL